VPSPGGVPPSEPTGSVGSSGFSTSTPPTSVSSSGGDGSSSPGSPSSGSSLPSPYSSRVTGSQPLSLRDPSGVVPVASWVQSPIESLASTRASPLTTSASPSVMMTRLPSPAPDPSGT